MGVKGDKATSEAALQAELFLEKLSALDGITGKKMFGGHGIFCNGKMFGIVDSKGQCYLKVDDSNKPDFEEAGASSHGKMSYYTIPEVVFSNNDELTKWAQKSILTTN
ncbi:MAG: TfoX/Sxy family protein [Cyclobacteriaceae bacterium]